MITILFPQKIVAHGSLTEVYGLTSQSEIASITINSPLDDLPVFDTSNDNSAKNVHSAIAILKPITTQLSIHDIAILKQCRDSPEPLIAKAEYSEKLSGRKIDRRVNFLMCSYSIDSMNTAPVYEEIVTHFKEAQNNDMLSILKIVEVVDDLESERTLNSLSEVQHFFDNEILPLQKFVDRFELSLYLSFLASNEVSRKWKALPRDVRQREQKVASVLASVPGKYLVATDVIFLNVNGWEYTSSPNTSAGKAYDIFSACDLSLPYPHLNSIGTKSSMAGYFRKIRTLAR